MEDRRSKRHRHAITKLLTQAVVVALGLHVVQCGGSGIVSRTMLHELSVGRYIIGDYDDDDNGGHDPDDRKTRTYGRPATSSDRHAAEEIIKRYYIAAAKDDGSAACQLMDKQVNNHDYSKFLPPEYMPTTGSSVFSHKNCQQIASLVLDPTHQQLAIDSSSVKVSELRVNRFSALAILSYTSDPESEIKLKRERNTWKIAAFLPTPLR